MKKSIFQFITFCLLSCLFTLRAQNIVTKVDSTQYATIYMYRPFSVLSPLLSFGIRKEGVKLFKLRNNSTCIIKVYQPGILILSAKSIERISSLSIACELGKSYYVRSKPRLSYLSVNPKLILMDTAQGRQEYQAIIDEN